MHAYSYEPNVTGGIVPETPRNDNWVLSPGADYVNTLCSASSREGGKFFNSDWLDLKEIDPLRDALRFGFNGVRETYEAEYISRVIRETGDQEKCVLHLIMRKTFPFGKLAEAMTLGSFINGARRKDGEPQLHPDYGTLSAERTGIENRSNLIQAINGLLAKGIIDRAPSAYEHGVSYVWPAAGFMDIELRCSS